MLGQNGLKYNRLRFGKIGKHKWNINFAKKNLKEYIVMWEYVKKSLKDKATVLWSCSWYIYASVIPHTVIPRLTSDPANEFFG